MTETQAAYFDIAYNYCELSGITLLVYDYIVTLPREISHLWEWPWGGYDPRDFSRNQSWLHYFRPKIDKSTLLYVLTRYTLLFAWILSPILSFHPDIDSCTPWLRFTQTMDIVSQITVAFILLLRTYALWGENLLVLIMLGFVGSGIPGIGIWSIVLTNCGYTFDASQESQLKLITMLFSLLTLIFDTCVAILTVYCYSRLRARKMAGGVFLRLILKNGLIHYAILFTAHISSVVMFWAAPMQLVGVGNYITRSLSVNVISHFMLDLKEMAHDATWQTATMSFVFFHDAELTTTAMIGGSVDQSEVTVT